jgi:hypothetical protein
MIMRKMGNFIFLKLPAARWTVIQPINVTNVLFFARLWKWSFLSKMGILGLGISYLKTKPSGISSFFSDFSFCKLLITVDYCLGPRNINFNNL